MLSSGASHLGQHRSLQLDAGPHLGDGWHRRELRFLRKLGRGGRLRHSRHRWSSRKLGCARHLRHRGLCRRDEVREGESLALDLMPFNRRLAEIFNVHRRRLTGSGRSLWRPARRRSRRRRRHRDDTGLFLQVIQEDGVLCGRIGNDTGAGRIEAELTITRPPHARCRLGRHSSTRRLRLGGAVGARGWRRRWCRNVAHSGDSLARAGRQATEVPLSRNQMLLTSETLRPYHACTSGLDVSL